MWMSATPSCGVRCHEPSTRGSRYSPDAAASAIRAHSSCFGTPRARSMSTFATVNSVDSDWIVCASAGASCGTPAIAATSASPDASTNTAASTHRSPPLFHSRIARSRPPSSSRTPVAQVWSSSSTPASSASRSHRTLSASMSYVTPVPAPYVFGALERGAVGGQPPRDLPAEPADDPPRLLAGRVERVERVEDGGRGPAHERQPVEQQRPGPEAGGRDRRGRAGRAGPDDDDVEQVVHRARAGARTAGPGSRRGSAPSPPRRSAAGAAARTWPSGSAARARRRRPGGSSAPRGPARARAGRGGRRRRPARSGRGRRCRGGTSSGRPCRTRA